SCRPNLRNSRSWVLVKPQPERKKRPSLASTQAHTQGIGAPSTQRGCRDANSDSGQARGCRIRGLASGSNPGVSRCEKGMLWPVDDWGREVSCGDLPQQGLGPWTHATTKDHPGWKLRNIFDEPPIQIGCSCLEAARHRGLVDLHQKVIRQEAAKVDFRRLDSV